MSSYEAQKESFQLILAGPRDNAPQFIEQLSAALAKELSISSHEVTQLLQSAPVTVAQASNASQLESLYDRLKSTGARVFILRTTKLASSNASSGSKTALTIEGYSRRPEGINNNLEYDSPNEQLSSLLGQLRKNALLDIWCNIEDPSPTNSPAQTAAESVSFWDAPTDWSGVTTDHNDNHSSTLDGDKTQQNRQKK